MICLAVLSAQAAGLAPHFSISPTGRFVAVQESDGAVWLINTSSGTRTALKKASASPPEVALWNFAWSPDDKSAFLVNGTALAYSLPKGRPVHAITAGAHLSLLSVSPDGRTLCSVRNNTLWFTSITGRRHAPLMPSGSGSLLIGTPDLVFAKEFDVPTHHWWSPDSSAVAYIETQFPDANHYILPGAKLPVFRLKTIDIQTNQTRLIAESSEAWPYLLRVLWHPDSKRIFFYRLNRLQTIAELCYSENGIVKTVFTDNDAYWINTPDTPVITGEGKQIVITSERSGSRRVYLYDLDGHLVSDLTPADVEIAALHASHEVAVYVSGSKAPHQERQLFRLNLDGSAAQQLTTEPGWHEITFSDAGNAYLDQYSTSLKPPTVTWHELNGQNREIQTAPSDDKPVANEFFTIKTHDNVQLPARLFKPDDFDPQKKYPVILYTFSGPRGHVVADQWGGWQMSWNRSMVRRGFLVLAVDARGSGGYGHLFEEYIHYRLGAQEIGDIREVVTELRRRPYVDSSRLGIWGCDYGAHTVVHAMFEFPGGFKAGFADSPITEWTKYDAYFAERYLGIPAGRFNEYNDSTPLHNARRMTGTLLAAAAAASDPLILPDQIEAMQTVVAKVKNPEVPKRFHVIPQPNNLTDLMARMTEFFCSTL